jgi:hypothetical protein
MPVSIVFGATANSLAKQFGRHGTDVGRWQKDADAITRLLIRGLISESAGRAARKKLLRIIAKAEAPKRLTRVW